MEYWNCLHNSNNNKDLGRIVSIMRIFGTIVIQYILTTPLLILKLQFCRGKRFKNSLFEEGSRPSKDQFEHQSAYQLLEVTKRGLLEDECQCRLVENAQFGGLVGLFMIGMVYLLVGWSKSQKLKLCRRFKTHHGFLG